MNENYDHLIDSMSYLYLPLYREFTRILVLPTSREDEESTYQVWSPSREIPPDVRSTEIMKLGLPFFKNHHYIAVPSDQSSPQWFHYQSQPDCSMFQSAVKLYSFKVLLWSSHVNTINLLIYPDHGTSGS